MRQKIILTVILATAAIYSCKKSDTKVSSSNPGGDPESCVQSEQPQNGDIIPGRYIIAYNESVVHTDQLSTRQLQNTSATVMERNNIASTRVRGTFEGLPGGFIADLTPDEVVSLKKDQSIALVEHDRVIALSTCFTVAEPRLITWNVNRVGYGDGRGKTAWIIDTGIDYGHPDLTVDTTRSRSFIDGVSSANDDNGHGTHVAGIIAALNNNIGTLGVASGAKVVALKVLNSTGEGSLSAIIQALGYINNTAHTGDVINMSLGIDTTSPVLVQQLQYTASRGIYVAIAAGNEHTMASRYSPANANGTNIYTVSAVDSLDNFASFSNYGNDAVDFAAPGVRILSTYPGGRYAYMSGTSMAAPHVAGLLLLKGNNITSSGTAKNDPDGTPDPIAHY
jgi:subtilisin family serine protease